MKKVQLREVWKNEASDFTTWLQDNLDIINDILDLQLDNAEREQSAGSFYADLIAEDDQYGNVIIENQLEKSDHDHLGKVLTYLTAYKAKVAIWIVAEARPEHIDAISFLNKSIDDCYFYMLKIEVITVDDSRPAPLLTKVVGPSSESKAIGAKQKDFSERDKRRHRFWSELLEIAKLKTPLHLNISPQRVSWIGAGSGTRGVGFNYSIRRDNGAVEIYIDRGKDSEEENKKIYNQLFSKKEEIEKLFGNNFDWNEMETRRAYKIRYIVEGFGGYSSDNWDGLIENMVDKMIKLEKVFKTFIDALEI